MNITAIPLKVRFRVHENRDEYIAHWNEELELYLVKETGAVISLYIPQGSEAADRDKIPEHLVLVLGALEVFSLRGENIHNPGHCRLSCRLFETDPDVRRVFCPPKDLYEERPSRVRS